EPLSRHCLANHLAELLQEGWITDSRDLFSVRSTGFGGRFGRLRNALNPTSGYPPKRMTIIGLTEGPSIYFRSLSVSCCQGIASATMFASSALKGSSRAASSSSVGSSFGSLTIPPPA